MSTSITLRSTPAQVMPPALGDLGDLGDLGMAVDAEGLAAHEHAVRHVAAAARSAGLSPVLAGVLADPGQPDVARGRAFGLLAARLTSLASAGPTGDARGPVGAAA